MPISMRTFMQSGLKTTILISSNGDCGRYPRRSCYYGGVILRKGP